MLPQNLGPVEVRVLGSLIEKQLSTPEHYPLSLNALTSACNQSTNREPVTVLDDGAVSRAVDSLRRLSLVRSLQSSGSRVPKYQHLLADAEALSSAELAVLCVLTLRGPQTLGEIKSRAARLMPGDRSDGVEAALDALMTREPAPVAARLPRRAGQKEVRYAHLLGGEVVHEAGDHPAPVVVAPDDRIAALELLTQGLRGDVADLRAQLEEFRKQFE